MTVAKRIFFTLAAFCSALACAGEEEGPPVWFPLAAPFRIADPGTIINGDTEKKSLIYDSLAPDVYQSRDRDEVQGSVLSVFPHARWFRGYFEAKPPEEIPRSDQGASLSLELRPSADGKLEFNLVMEARDRDVWTEIEHRRTNLTPFLFSFAVSGKLIQAKPSNEAIGGGVKAMTLLVKKGDRGTWNFTIDARSLLSFLPQGQASELSVIASFSEFRHDDGTGMRKREPGELEAELKAILGDVPTIADDPRPEFDQTPILIRSNCAAIGFDGRNWIGTKKP